MCMYAFVYNSLVSAMRCFSSAMFACDALQACVFAYFDFPQAHIFRVLGKIKINLRKFVRAAGADTTDVLHSFS